MSTQKMYRITYVQYDKIIEIYAGKVLQSDLYGFIEVEKIAFDERSKLLVDPAQEKLQALFDGVKRTFIPVAMVIRIDEVSKQGPLKISPATGGVISHFPPASSPHKKN